jgi:hypothetical protein
LMDPIRWHDHEEMQKGHDQKLSVLIDSFTIISQRTMPYSLARSVQ